MSGGWPGMRGCGVYRKNGVGAGIARPDGGCSAYRQNVRPDGGTCVFFGRPVAAPTRVRCATDAWRGDGSRGTTPQSASLTAPLTQGSLWRAADSRPYGVYRHEARVRQAAFSFRRNENRSGARSSPRAQHAGGMLYLRGSTPLFFRSIKRKRPPCGRSFAFED